MKIQLEQHEIETAVREYVANQGIQVAGKELTLKFTMTRGETGLLADLTIDEPKSAETKTVTKRAGVNTVPAKEGTVGGAIAKQSAPKATEAPATNVTSATEALAQANAAAEAAKAASTTTEAETADASESAAVEEAPAVTEAPKATTSLFG